MKVHETAIIEEGAKIGSGTNIWHFSHIRSGAIIGNNCNIGKDVYMDPGVVIGNNVKIQNGVSLYEGISVDDDVFIGPHAVFTNDLQPRAFLKDWQLTKTLLRKGCSIGANATIICGVTIGKYALIGAGTVVTKDIPDFSLVVGNPGKIIGMVDKQGKRIS